MSVLYCGKFVFFAICFPDIFIEFIHPSDKKGKKNKSG